jgi:hypothetical protein
MKVIGAQFHGRYDTARGTAQIISALGWIATALGAFIALGSLASASAAGPLAGIGIGVGLLIAVAGLLQVAAGQGVRAALDSADYARQSFKLQVAQAEGKGEIDLRDYSAPYTPAPSHQSTSYTSNRPYPPNRPQAAQTHRPAPKPEPVRDPNIRDEGVFNGRRWRQLRDGTVEGELLGGSFKSFQSLEEFKKYIS